MIERITKDPIPVDRSGLTKIINCCGKTLMPGMIANHVHVFMSASSQAQMLDATTHLDLPPTKPCWVFESAYLHYQGDAGASVTLPTSGLKVANLDATSDAFLPGGFHTFKTKVAGAFNSVGGFLGSGFNAFFYEQITGDSGSGAKLGDFKGRSTGVGPVLTYIMPLGENKLVTEARWLPELDTKRHLEGDYFWLKLVYQF